MCFYVSFCTFVSEVAVQLSIIRSEDYDASSTPPQALDGKLMLQLM